MQLVPNDFHTCVGFDQRVILAKRIGEFSFEPTAGQLLSGVCVGLPKALLVSPPGFLLQRSYVDPELPVLLFELANDSELVVGVLFVVGELV